MPYYPEYMASGGKVRQLISLIENNLELGDRIVFSDGTNYSSSTYYSNLYDDTVWNFAIRKKPNYDTLFGVSTPSDYTIELYAVNGKLL